MSTHTSGLDDQVLAELREIAGRYPQPRSGLLPMLHLVQSVEGRLILVVMPSLFLLAIFLVDLCRPRSPVAES